MSPVDSPKSVLFAFASDALHSLGGYPGNDDEGRAMQRSMDKAKIEQDFLAAAGYLKSHELFANVSLSQKTALGLEITRLIEFSEHLQVNSEAVLKTSEIDVVRL